MHDFLKTGPNPFIHANDKFTIYVFPILIKGGGGEDPINSQSMFPLPKVAIYTVHANFGTKVEKIQNFN